MPGKWSSCISLDLSKWIAIVTARDVAHAMPTIRADGHALPLGFEFFPGDLHSILVHPTEKYFLGLVDGQHVEFLKVCFNRELD